MSKKNTLLSAVHSKARVKFCVFSTTQFKPLASENVFFIWDEFVRPNSTELCWIGTKVLSDNYLFSLHHPMTLGPSEKHSADVQSEQEQNNKNSVSPHIQNRSMTVKKRVINDLFEQAFSRTTGELSVDDLSSRRSAE